MRSRSSFISSCFSHVGLTIPGCPSGMCDSRGLSVSNHSSSIAKRLKQTPTVPSSFFLNRYEWGCVCFCGVLILFISHSLKPYLTMKVSAVGLGVYDAEIMVCSSVKVLQFVCRSLSEIWLNNYKKIRLLSKMSVNIH